MCETKDFTPMKGDLGRIVGIENVYKVIVRRYPETTRLRFLGIWNFFEGRELVAQAWAETSESWNVVIKPVRGTS